MIGVLEGEMESVEGEEARRKAEGADRVFIGSATRSSGVAFLATSYRSGPSAHVAAVREAMRWYLQANFAWWG